MSPSLPGLCFLGVVVRLLGGDKAAGKSHWEAAFLVTGMPGGSCTFEDPTPRAPGTLLPSQQLQGGKGGVQGGAHRVQISCLFVLEVGCLLIIRSVYI